MSPQRTIVAVLAAAVAAIALVAAVAGASSTALEVKARHSAYGSVLFDGRGRALYLFTKDGRGPTRCYGACADAWPPATVSGRPRAGHGVRASLLGTTRRRGGARQLTYAGQPLYYYVGDGRGEIKCQAVAEFGGTWLVVAPSGRAVG